MESYTDEKHPDVAYRVIEIEAEEPMPRPKRPVWRRFLRVILTVVGISMIWSTFAPLVGHGCHRHARHGPRPPADLPPQFRDGSDLGAAEEPPALHYTFSPDITKFWIKQDSFHGLTRTEVVGDIIVAGCPKAENISVHFKFDVSDDSLVSRFSITPEEDGITFKLDPFSIVRQKVNATVWVVIPQKDDYQLEDLRVGSTQLHVWLKESFTTSVENSHVSAVSGDITSLGKSGDKNGLNINNLKVTDVSGNINGEFPLNNALDLETTSGSIVADIASSDRREKIGWLKTVSVSGQTTVKFISILNPRPLYSKHNTVSGDLRIDYPEDWQGGLKLETTSGHIEVSGKGTKVVKKEKDVGGKFWKVIKGEGKSKGFIGTVSGKIDVLIGEPEDQE